MPAGENYCRICYRTIEPDRDTCPDCRPERRMADKQARGAAWLGVLAVPLLFVGMLTFSHRLVVAAAIVAGAAVVVTTALALRQR